MWFKDIKYFFLLSARDDFSIKLELQEKELLDAQQKVSVFYECTLQK